MTEARRPDDASGTVARSRTLRYPPAARAAFAVAAAFLLLFVANVASRFAWIKFRVDLWRLGDVGEFLLVLLCMVFFVAGLMALEAWSSSSAPPEGGLDTNQGGGKQ